LTSDVEITLRPLLENLQTHASADRSSVYTAARDVLMDQREGYTNNFVAAVTRTLIQNLEFDQQETVLLLKDVILKNPKNAETIINTVIDYKDTQKISTQTFTDLFSSLLESESKSAINAVFKCYSIKLHPNGTLEKGLLIDLYSDSSMLTPFIKVLNSNSSPVDQKLRAIELCRHYLYLPEVQEAIISEDRRVPNRRDSKGRIKEYREVLNEVMKVFKYGGMFKSPARLEEEAPPNYGVDFPRVPFLVFMPGISPLSATVPPRGIKRIDDPTMQNTFYNFEIRIAGRFNPTGVNTNSLMEIDLKSSDVRNYIEYRSGPIDQGRANFAPQVNLSDKAFMLGDSHIFPLMVRVVPESIYLGPDQIHEHDELYVYATLLLELERDKNGNPSVMKLDSLNAMKYSNPYITLDLRSLNTASLFEVTEPLYADPTAEVVRNIHKEWEEEGLLKYTSQLDNSSKLRYFNLPRLLFNLVSVQEDDVLSKSLEIIEHYQQNSSPGIQDLETMSSYILVFMDVSNFFSTYKLELYKRIALFVDTIQDNMLPEESRAEGSNFNILQKRMAKVQ
jgi:hypothetical protein